MEYWLRHIDNQKLSKKSRLENANPKLPDKISDSRQQTAAWIIEHKKIWTNTHKVRLKDDTTRLTGFSRQTPNLITNAQSKKIKNEHQSFIQTLRNFNLANFGNSNKTSKEAIFIKKSPRRRSQLFEELDTQHQLVINYARIDAIANSRLNKIIKESNNPKKLVSNVTSLFKNTNNNDLSNLRFEEAYMTCSKNELNEQTQTIRALRKRRHSWPRCKTDNLKLNAYNRNLRYNYHRQEQKQRHIKMLNQLNYPDFELWFEHRDEFINLV